ncbi:hypothetical protein EBR57_05675 [bacterium]|nr:hypothetical protein [bacterium]
MPSNPLSVITPVTSSVTLLLGYFGDPIVTSPWVSSEDEFLTQFPVAKWRDRLAVRLFFENGGQHLIIFNTGSSEPATLIHRDPLSERVWLGDAVLSGLNDISSFDLLIVSPEFQINGTQWYTALQAYCDQRDAILLISPPPLPRDEIGDWFESHPELHKRHVAIYFPPITVGEDHIGPVYSVAGIFNRLAQTNGVWIAPSGAAAYLDGTSTPMIALKNEETLRLNNMGINCIRSFKSIGTVIWGNTTGVGLDSPNGYWKYISVRRTLFYIKKCIQDALRPLHVIPYYRGVEDDVIAIVEPFLLELYTLGAFAGKSDRESYSILCEPHGDGIQVSAGLALLKPDELVGIKVIVQMLRQEI